MNEQTKEITISKSEQLVCTPATKTLIITNEQAEKLDIIIEPNANVQIITLNKKPSTTTQTIIVKENATVHWTDIITGDQTRTTTTHLQESNASIEHVTLFLGKDDNKQNIISNAQHEAKQTKANIIIKGISDDKAKTKTQGLINITKNASGSEGYQKIDVLLLSKQAKAIAIPDLAIHNYDVKCSHGATIGRINKEQLYYLQSRGLTKNEAKKLIINGFFKQHIDLLPAKQEQITEVLHA